MIDRQEANKVIANKNAIGLDMGGLLFELKNIFLFYTS